MAVFHELPVSEQSEALRAALTAYESGYSYQVAIGTTPDGRTYVAVAFKCRGTVVINEQIVGSVSEPTEPPGVVWKTHQRPQRPKRRVLPRK